MFGGKAGWKLSPVSENPTPLVRKSCSNWNFSGTFNEFSARWPQFIDSAFMTVFGKVRKNPSNYRFVDIDICLRDVCLVGWHVGSFPNFCLTSDTFHQILINAFAKGKLWCGSRMYFRGPISIKGFDVQYVRFVFFIIVKWKWKALFEFGNPLE